MFGLPGARDPGMAGAFPGPLLLTHGGRWLSPSIARPALLLDGVPAPVEWEGPREGWVSLHPGLLRQSIRIGPLQGRAELVFASWTTALIRVQLVNKEERRVVVEAGWEGGPLFMEVAVAPAGGGVDLCLPAPGGTLAIRPVASGYASRLAGAGKGGSSGVLYTLRGPKDEVAPGDTLTLFLALTLLEEGEEAGPGDSTGGASLLGVDPDLVFRDVRARWGGYLEGALEGVGDARARRVGAKAVLTLISNWRRARGHLFHDGLFPSYAYRGFHGVWSWDSWKHARALALFAPELAKDQMRVMLDQQGPAGMIPDVIYVDSTENNWRDTKPPLAAWAAYGIFEATGDTAFVAEVLPALLRYHRWWYRYRDHDGNGLCEYGSTDGTRVAAAWESGMDNAVRFDDAGMIRSGPQAWSLTQESVDLNAYLYAEKGYLAELAEVVGRREEAEGLRREERALGQAIRETFFHEKTGYFYDVAMGTKAPIQVQGPEGWIPLWAGAATSEQAASVASVMTDPAKFAGPMPLPTLAMDHPDFDPSQGYWRGPVWLDQAYFGIQGLRRYGFHAQADILQGRLFTGAEGLMGRGPIYENYDPRSGRGLNALHFSWSAAHYLLLLREGGQTMGSGRE